VAVNCLFLPHVMILSASDLAIDVDERGGDVVLAQSARRGPFEGAAAGEPF